MRIALLLVGLLLGLAIAAPAAEAQSQTAMMMALRAPETAFESDNRTKTLSGVVTLVADPGAYQHMNGIKVEYSVTGLPSWATAVISPSEDIFPPPTTPGFTYTATRTFQVQVRVDPALEETSLDVLEITAVTQGGTARQAPAARAAVPLSFSGLDPVCDAANPLAGLDKEESPTPVTVQGGAQMPLSTPWAAVAGFGLVGAGIGLVLRRRL